MPILDTLIKSILALSCIFFPICNLLVYPLKRVYKYLLYTLITLITFFLLPTLGSYVNIIIYSVILISIAILSKYPILDICLAVVGYLLIVCANYIYILVISHFNITVIMLETDYYIISGTALTIVFYFASKWLGNIIRPIIISWQFARPNPLLSKNTQLLCLLELLACFCIYQFNIIYGQIAGYSSNIITYNASLFVTFFVITLVIFYLLIRTLKKESQLAAKVKEYEVIQDYTQKVEQLYLDIRTFKHDYLNILSTMGLYLDQKQYDELEAYFKKYILSQEENLTNKDYILGKLALLHVKEIKGLLYPKLLSAINQRLQIIVDIKDPVTKIAVDYLDLIRILGIFIDNAIEASVESEEKTLYVGLLVDDDTVIIRICNSCNEVANFHRLADINVSSKSGSRGIGLYNANLLIKKHSNMIHKTSCENRIFTQELQIIGGD